MNPMGDTNAFFARDNQHPIRNLRPWRFTISDLRKSFVGNFQEIPDLFPLTFTVVSCIEGQKGD